MKTLILFLGLTISVSSYSQFSAGLETGMSMSNTHDIGSCAIGGSLRYEMPLHNNLNFTCSMDYLSFSEKFQDGFPTGNKIITISGGGKYYFSESSKGFYGAIDLTMNFISYNTSYPDFSDTKDKRLGLSPGIGYRTSRWDATGRYNAVSQANYLSLRVAYILNSK